MNSKELLSQITQNLEKIARERDSLRERSTAKDEEIMILKAEINTLKGQVESSLGNASAMDNLNDTSNNEVLKKRIDGLVEEIDECLALLNN